MMNTTRLTYVLLHIRQYTGLCAFCFAVIGIILSTVTVLKPLRGVSLIINSVHCILKHLYIYIYIYIVCSYDVLYGSLWFCC